MDTYTEALHPRLHGRWIEKGGEAPSVGKGDSKTPTKGGIPKGMTVESAKAFLDGHYKKWRTGLSPAHEKAMRFYQSPGFALMNGQLRGLDTAGLKTRERASDSDLARAKIASKNLVAAIKTAPPLTGPLTVYRGYDAARYPSQVGATVTEPAFTSTSLTPNVATVGKATEQAVAEITLPAGTRAAAGSSRELVLPPGAKFKVTKVTTKRGVRHVSMEYLPPAEKTKTVTASLAAQVDELLAELDDWPVLTADVSTMPPQLRESYLHGKVAERIEWGVPGDFLRCVAQAKIHGMGHMAEGACATLHHEALGVWPGGEHSKAASALAAATGGHHVAGEPYRVSARVDPDWRPGPAG